MKIHVTQEDIDKGRRHFCDTCPIARAPTREVGGFWLAGTNALQTFLRKSKIAYSVPRSVHRFIRAFDKGKPVKPFNFILK